ncbi:tail fiber domain-containing protein [Methylobacterium sp. HMF5984]|uniref:tail fiber domain-containing protein n=1 Tax=Methylobacterium sp. HMF5984 TaxID=3367370 RepID=UPI003853A1A0
MALSKLTSQDAGAAARGKINAGLDAVDGQAASTAQAQQLAAGAQATAQATAAAALRGQDVLPATRPGNGPRSFTQSLAGGAASALPALPDTALAFGPDGASARLVGAGVVAQRGVCAVEPGRMYLPRFVVRRLVNTSDPSNDTVRCALAWFDQVGQPLSGANAFSVVRDLTALKVADGLIDISDSFVAREEAAGIAIAAPANACYVRAYVQQFGGTATTDVLVINWQDTSNANVLSPDFSAFTARVAQLESAQAAARLTVLEQNAAAPITVGFTSYAAIQAANVPSFVGRITTLGYRYNGKGAATYVRASGQPAHPFRVQSKDGAWWEGADDVVTTYHLGAYGDGVQDDAQALRDLWTVMMTLGRKGDLLSGTYRCASQVAWDYGARTQTPPALTGAGYHLAAIAFDANVPGPNLYIYSSGIGAPAGVDMFYGAVGNFAVRGNTPGIVFQIGKEDYSDAHNSCYYGPFVANNASTDAAACAFETNVCYDSHITCIANCSGRPASGNGISPSTTAWRIRRCPFTNFYGSGGNAGRLIHFAGSYTYSSNFIGVDLEVGGIGIVCDDPNAKNIRFLGGTNVLVDYCADNPGGGRDILVDGMSASPDVGLIKTNVNDGLQIIADSVTGRGTFKGTVSANAIGVDTFVQAVRTDGASAQLYASAGAALLRSIGAFPVAIAPNGVTRWTFDTSGNLVPNASGTQVLGGGNNRLLSAFLVNLDVKTTGSDATATVARDGGATAQLYSAGDEASLRSVGNQRLAFYVNNARNWYMSTTNEFLPATDAAFNIGGASARINNLFLANNPIVSSDIRFKKRRGELTEAEIRAWADVKPCIFQYLAAIADKGEASARLHAGYIAQDVIEAFAAHGLVAFAYGVVGSDVLTTKEQKVTSTARRPKMQTITEARVEVVVQDGRAVQQVVEHAAEVPVMRELPLFDESGAPVMIETPSSESASPIQHIYADGDGVQSRSGAEIVGGDAPAPMRVQATYLVPEMEDVDVVEEVEVPVLDATGAPETRLVLRYDQCAVFEAALQRWQSALHGGRLVAIEQRLATLPAS